MVCNPGKYVVVDSQIGPMCTFIFKAQSKCELRSLGGSAFSLRTSVGSSECVSKVVPLGLLEGPESWWFHEIRQGLRLAEWRKAGNRRNDMRGIESMAGIDKLAAAKAMNSTEIPPEQRNDLRELLCGCVWTHKMHLKTPLRLFFVVRKLRMNSIFSGGAQGGRMRRCDKQVSNDLGRSAWPPCTSRYGIFLEEHIRSAATPCQTASFRMRGVEGKPRAMKTWWLELMEHVSAIRMRGSEERAVVYSLVSTMTNCSFTLPGREQTNNCAGCHHCDACP